jgi:cysteine-rich repeat protein
VVCGDGIVEAPDESCDDGNLVPGDLCDARCQVEPLLFEYTGGEQMVVLPDWVEAVFVEAWGAQGGDSMCCDKSEQQDGGFGGYAAGTITVPVEATLTVFVGGQGVLGGAGGFNGGGGPGGLYGTGGGGASDVRIGGGELVDRAIVAGGGGGGQCGCPDEGEGGAGGGLEGAPGLAFNAHIPGGGGTQVAGGSGGPGVGGRAGSPGGFGYGGGPVVPGDNEHVAGGGGGYYGGGAAYGGGGGGGSSYIDAAPDGITMPGVRLDDGEVHITPISYQ